MAWNLSGFTIIMFSLNHYTPFFDSEVKLLINSSRDFSVHEIVLGSAKLCNSAFSIQSKRSLMKMLIRMGPKIDLCGTPNNKIRKTLYIYHSSSPFASYSRDYTLFCFCAKLEGSKVTNFMKKALKLI